jgi:hypothetical protein
MLALPTVSTAPQQMAELRVTGHVGKRSTASYFSPRLLKQKIISPRSQYDPLSQYFGAHKV